MKKKIFMVSLLVNVLWLSAQKTYTVKSGDTLYGIAKTNNVDFKNLLKANPGMEKSTLEIGQKIIIPGKSSSNAAPTEYGMIVVQPQQTLWGLARQYKISEKEIQRLNPSLQMKIGEEIKLPAKNIKKYADKDAFVRYDVPSKTELPPATATPSLPSDSFTLYKVESGDTVLNIVQKFGISLDDFLAMNPSAANGIEPGTSVKVKKITGSFAKKSSGVYDINLMLPFGFGEKDTQYQKLALEFMKGAKLAAENQTAEGLPIHLRVIDAGNEQTFQNALSQINKDNTDLIIGPFFKSNILQMMEYVKGTQIPVVAPFANSEDLHAFSNLIMVETATKTYLDAIVKEVASSYKAEKIFLLADVDNENMAYISNKLKQTLGSSTDIQIVADAELIRPEKNIATGLAAPLIIINIESNEAKQKGFVKQIEDLIAENVSIKAFSTVYNGLYDSKSDLLGKASLIYLMDRRINTDGEFEKKIIQAYKKKYCETPSKYAVIGFDVMNDLLSRMNVNGLFKNIDKEQTQLATKFNFEKIGNKGAYINTGYRIIRLLP